MSVQLHIVEELPESGAKGHLYGCACKKISTIRCIY